MNRRLDPLAVVILGLIVVVVMEWKHFDKCFESLAESTQEIAQECPPLLIAMLLMTIVAIAKIVKGQQDDDNDGPSIDDIRPFGS